MILMQGPPESWGALRRRCERFPLHLRLGFGAVHAVAPRFHAAPTVCDAAGCRGALAHPAACDTKRTRSDSTRAPCIPCTHHRETVRKQAVTGGRGVPGRTLCAGRHTQLIHAAQGRRVVSAESGPTTSQERLATTCNGRHIARW